ncbi:phage protein NinX family protein [Xenorhabdus stockiae]|uniref:phage protein NinX family protein n=1 Tax=Xenorhabdus stockiae TaxID=351614 RepID=UPI003CFB48FE
MKIKTSELTGKALDWAVALAQGWQKMADYNGYSTPNGVVIPLVERSHESVIAILIPSKTNITLTVDYVHLHVHFFHDT